MFVFVVICALTQSYIFMSVSKTIRVRSPTLHPHFASIALLSRSNFELLYCQSYRLLYFVKVCAVPDRAGLPWEHRGSIHLKSHRDSVLKTTPELFSDMYCHLSPTVLCTCVTATQGTFFGFEHTVHLSCLPCGSTSYLVMPSVFSFTCVLMVYTSVSILSYYKLKTNSSQADTHSHTHRRTLCQWAGGLRGGPEFCRDCHTLLYSWRRSRNTETPTVGKCHMIKVPM